MKTALKTHWESIYMTKSPAEVSWTQDIPHLSLEFIRSFQLPKDSPIIDVGGGDSRLVDFLLKDGYTDVTVLDISAAAIERARARLGGDGDKVAWIESDILDFKPDRKYMLWHDRAAFHFQTTNESVNRYLEIIEKAVNGFAVIGTFSTCGPLKCSGLDIRQYDEDSLKSTFEKRGFKPLSCKREDHITPSGNAQNFVFCGFQKKP